MSTFISSMIDFFLESNEENELTELSDEEKLKIESLAESKNRSWEWNYSYGPEYQFNNTFEFEGKPHRCSMQVKDGIISECRIEGSEKLEALAEKIKGCRHMVQMVRHVLEDMHLKYDPSLVDRFF